MTSRPSIFNRDSGNVSQNTIQNVGNHTSTEVHRVVGDVYTGNIYINTFLVGMDDGQVRHSGIEILRASSSLGALHDSEARSQSSKCHPGTRIEYLEAIESWVWDEDDSCHAILSLSGPNGAGKTAIVQTIAEEFAAMKLLGGSFFFSRDVGERKTLSRLVTTIATQLCSSMPEVNHLIEGAAERDPHIAQRTITTQFQMLIVEPLLEYEAYLKNHGSGCAPPLSRKVIVIDAIDECDNADHQRHLVELLLRVVDSHTLPLRFLITSRIKEGRLKDALSSDLAKKHIFELVLSDSESAIRDICVFLRTGFAEIRLKYQGKINFPDAWPGEETVLRLAKRSGGTFIYPTTALKFVDIESANPIEQLRLILPPETPGTSSPPASPPMKMKHSTSTSSTSSLPSPTSHSLSPTFSPASISSMRPTQSRVSLSQPRPIRSADGSPVPYHASRSPRPGSRSPNRYDSQGRLKVNATDDLYHAILSSERADQSPHTLTIIGIILTLGKGATIAYIAALMGLQPGEVSAAFVSLHPLIHVPEWTNKDIMMRHASFGDFLRNKERSGRFYIDSAKIHAVITLGSLRVIEECVQADNVCVDRSEFFMQCLENWMLHLIQVDPTPEFLVEFYKFDIHAIVEYTGLYTQGSGGYFSRVDLLYCWTITKMHLLDDVFRQDLIRSCFHSVNSRKELEDLTPLQIETFGLLSVIHHQVPIWPPSPIVERLLSRPEHRLVEIISHKQHILINCFLNMTNSFNRLVFKSLCTSGGISDMSKLHGQMAISCLYIIIEEQSEGLQRSTADDVVTPLDYAWKYWAHHVGASDDSEMLFLLLRNLTSKLKPRANEEQLHNAIEWLTTHNFDDGQVAEQWCNTDEVIELN